MSTPSLKSSLVPEKRWSSASATFSQVGAFYGSDASFSYLSGSAVETSTSDTYPGDIADSCVEFQQGYANQQQQQQEFPLQQIPQPWSYTGSSQPAVPGSGKDLINCSVFKPTII